MSWRAYYENATGRLVSVGTVFPPDIPPGLAYIEGAEPIPDVMTSMWSVATRSFVARPPKVIIDRLQAILTDPNYTDWQAVWNALNATRRNQVTSALSRLLGRQRYKSESDPMEVGSA